MKRKSIILFILLGISLILNIYLISTNYIKSTYTPNDEDLVILGEMTKMVIETKQYEEIAARETVYSIKPSVSRFNVADPSSIFHYEIYVQTDQSTYIFYCTDDTCTEVSNEGWTYSRYQDEEPVLPLKKPE